MNDAPKDFAYTGINNLEVMLEAERYNTFLTDLVLKYRIGNGPILDFGAGIGTFSEMVRDRGISVDCLEVDAYQFDVLKKKGFKVFSSTADVPYDTYDYIFSLNVFEHIEHDVDAMQKCARIVRPNGVILTYVPAFPVLFGDMDRKVEHYRRYTRQSITSISEAADLSVVHTEYVDIAGYFASIVYNLTSRSRGDIDSKSIKIYDRYIFPVSRFIDRATHTFIGKNVFSVAQKLKVGEKHQSRV